MSTRKYWGAVASATAITAATLSAASAPTAQAAPGCPDMYVVAVPGTWETSRAEPRQGMLSAVTDGLPGNIRTDYVHYAATALPWEGDVYGRSKQEAFDGARWLVGDMSRQCGAATKIALIGYSQGADAAGDLASEIGTGLGVVPPDRVAAVGLLADPRRSPADATVGPAVAGAGAGGPRLSGFGWVSPRVRSICAVGDLYCSTPPDDFAARFAGFFAQMSAPDPGLSGKYQAQAQAIIDDLMAAGGLPTLQGQFSDSANAQRMQQLQDFNDSAVHQSYASYVVDGSGITATAWLRRWLIDASR
ncbi:cutinase family protein [Nocardia thraciensis]